MTHNPRTRDEAGRIRRPCPHCGNIEQQRYCGVQDDGEGGGVEIWNCDSPACAYGSHSYRLDQVALLELRSARVTGL